MAFSITSCGCYKQHQPVAGVHIIPEQLWVRSQRRSYNHLALPFSETLHIKWTLKHTFEERNKHSNFSNHLSTSTMTYLGHLNQKNSEKLIIKSVLWSGHIDMLTTLRHVPSLLPNTAIAFISLRSTLCYVSYVLKLVQYGSSFSLCTVRTYWGTGKKAMFYIFLCLQSIWQVKNKVSRREIPSLMGALFIWNVTFKLLTQHQFYSSS